jgi:hypothetical protein
MKGYKKKGGPPKSKPKIPPCSTCQEASRIIKGTSPETWGHTVSWALDHIAKCPTLYAQKLRRQQKARIPNIYLRK